MATAPELTAARQLWLDVDRPVLMRPRRERSSAPEAEPVVTAAKQIEFRIASSGAKPAFYPPIERSPPIPLVRDAAPLPCMESAELFAAWLLNQSKKPGSIGELAKAVKLDRHFPKAGSADDVRRYFGSIGAEGDAFEALDDAERAYDRL